MYVLESLFSSEYFYLYLSLAILLISAYFPICKKLYPKLDRKIASIEKDILHASELYQSAFASLEIAKRRYDDVTSNNHMLMLSASNEVKKMNDELKRKIEEAALHRDKFLEEQERACKAEMMYILRQEMVLMMTGIISTKLNNDKNLQQDIEFYLNDKTLESLGKIFN